MNAVAFDPCDVTGTRTSRLTTCLPLDTFATTLYSILSARVCNELPQMLPPL